MGRNPAALDGDNYSGGDPFLLSCVFLLALQCTDKVTNPNTSSGWESEHSKTKVGTAYLDHSEAYMSRANSEQLNDNRMKPCTPFASLQSSSSAEHRQTIHIVVKGEGA